MPAFVYHILENTAVGSAASEVTEAVVSRTPSGTVYVSWWSSYPLLITFLVILLSTAALLFAAIIAMIILENKNHKLQIKILVNELNKFYEGNGTPINIKNLSDTLDEFKKK